MRSARGARRVVSAVLFILVAVYVFRNLWMKRPWDSLLSLAGASDKSNEAAAASFTRKERHPHHYVFIGGAHFSATTLLQDFLRGENDFSVFTDTRAKQDEGQHLQSVYPAANVSGGVCGFGLVSKNHLTEESVYLKRGDEIMRSWKRYWNMSKTFLVEKSPPHIMQTRFLQRLVHPEPASFIILMRHPLDVLSKHCRRTKRHRKFEFSVALRYIDNWLAMYETFFDQDAAQIHRYKVLRFEEWTASKKTAQAAIRNIVDWLGAASISGTTNRAPELKSSSTSKVGNVYAPQETRTRDSLEWTSEEVKRGYDARLKRFGYSLTS